MSSFCGKMKEERKECGIRRSTAKTGFAGNRVFGNTLVLAFRFHSGHIPFSKFYHLINRAKFSLCQFCNKQ